MANRPPEWFVRIVKRFWLKVHKTEDGCWTWRAGLTSDGYGSFWYNAAVGSVLAHVFSWSLTNGPVPADAVIDHLCKNRACVNPKHLQAVTQAENTARGDSPTAVNARRNECVRGHLFTPENTYRQPSGARACRRCLRMSNQRYARTHRHRGRERQRRHRERESS